MESTTYKSSQESSDGTNTSSSYSTIYMAKFEETFIYHYIIGLCATYLRYIDDIFMIWTYTKEKFEQFIKELNPKHPSIKCDYKISAKEVDFLDATVYIEAVCFMVCLKRLFSKHLYHQIMVSIRNDKTD